MEHKNLQKTKFKLTVLFTVSLFCIVFILGIVFFSFRFGQSHRVEKNAFFAVTQKHIQDISKQDDILSFLGIDVESETVEDLFPQGGKKNQNTAISRQKPVSFFVVSDNGEILEKSLKENIEFDELLDIRRGKVYYNEGIFMRKEPVSFFLEDATIYFYKRATYPLSSYMSDLSIFTFILIIFSSILYVFSYKFVGRTLRPVEQNLDDMRDFIHNAGHELKTPLSVLHGNLQVMGAEKKLDPKLLKQGIKEVDRLSGLIDGLVELSQTGKSSQKETFPLMIEVARIVTEFKEYAKDHDVEVKNSVTGQYTLYANRQDLYVVVSNILKNAIKYNSKKGEVYISFQKGILTIHDTGIGISKGDQEKIFERFYQGKSARSSEGFGIGLSLVKKVADINGWDIHIDSKVGEGTSFKITF